MAILNTPSVLAVSKHIHHTFSKPTCDSINLVESMGVEGDAHYGATVQHRSRVKADPTQPNLRQVHLIHHELLELLNQQGFSVACGDMGENITTINLDLLSLPRNTLLHIGENAVVRVTGLRNPCKQLDHFQDGLMNAVLERSDSGELIRKAGIMAVVTQSGQIFPGDGISIEYPQGPHQGLERV